MTHGEQRWYWSLSAKDSLTSLGQAVRVYQARFDQQPETVWLNPQIIQQLQPVGIDVQPDGHLPRAMAAFSLPDGWQPVELDLVQLELI